MNFIKTIFICSYILLLIGCVSMNAPASSLIETMPVITIGDTKEVSEDPIIFIPAGIKFPFEFSVKGTVFEENVTSKIMVSINRNMYLYKSWASLDGKVWVNSHELINVDISGGFDKAGGKVGVTLNVPE